MEEEKEESSAVALDFHFVYCLTLADSIVYYP